MRLLPGFVAGLLALGSREAAAADGLRVRLEAGLTGESLDPDALHSTYRFLEVQVLADQALSSRLRLRLSLNARDERHDDASQDSRSLYFSLDLRRLF